MPDPPLPPGALDRLARDVARERTRSAPGAAPAFGWTPDPGSPATLGRFRIVATLGRGGMGIVYRAVDPRTQAEVALKSLAAGPAERLRREGEAIARLNHPGLVRVLESGEDRGSPFLVMELVRGRPLDEAWAAWDLRRRVEAVERIARAIAHAHGRGVAHRDLKPGNVLVGEDGAPRVTDFGLAAVDDARTTLTDPGSVMGTPAWMAPEQVRGEPAGPPADVHALGSLLFLALTGAPPYGGPNPPAIYRAITDDDPPWPRKRAPDVPAGLEAVCLAALRKSAGERPAADAVADDLARWLRGEPVASHLPSAASRLARRLRRNPLGWAALAAALLAVAAGAAALGVQAARHARAGKARDLARDAQPLAVQALLSLAAGDEDGAASRMAAFEGRMAAVRELDPSAVGGWFERAEYRRLRGDEDGARAIVEEGLAAQPDDSLLRLERGLLAAADYRREARRAELAAEASARAGGPRTLHPDAGRKLEALLARATADLDAGIAGLGGDPPPSARVARAELALLQGDPGRARTLVEGLEQPEAKMVRGGAAEAERDLPAAIDWYGKAIATRARFWPAWEARATARERLAAARWTPGAESGEADQADAIADWSHAAESLPLRGDLQVALSTASWKLGQMRIYRQGDPTEPCRRAVDAAEAAVRLDTGDGRAHFAAGRAWSELADHTASRRADAGPPYANALSALRTAARIGPDEFDVRLELARTLRMRGFWKRATGQPHAEDYEHAIRAYGEVLRISPDWLPAHCNQGLILFELERWSDAAAAFEKAGRWTTDDPVLRDRYAEAKRRAGR